MDAPSGRVMTYANQNEKTAFQWNHRKPMAGTAITAANRTAEGK